MAQTPTNREVPICGYIVHPDKTPPYISPLPKIHKMKTLQTQIEKYTYRPPNQTITNCHTFKERSKTQNGIYIIKTVINRITNHITR